MKPALYDHTLSYEENYVKGPPLLSQDLKPQSKVKTTKQKFLGFDVNLPFGIPSGPLLNSQFIKTAFDFGFDVSTYKTVRANEFPCHPFPNVLFVNAPQELYPEEVLRLHASLTTERSKEEISITNSFGVPSKKPELWQEDVKKALAFQREGQLLILSFMGTTRENQTEEEFLLDWRQAANLSYATGVRALEANLSCPNIGNEGLVCYDLRMTEKICQVIRKEIHDTPLILKVGHYQNDHEIEALAKIANTYAQAIASVNSLQTEIVDEHGDQALPGKNRLKSGVCGASIKWAGLEMTHKLAKVREEKGYNYEILGIGGVMTPEDYHEYRKAGADCVQSATGAMWNPYLAADILKKSV